MKKFVLFLILLSSRSYALNFDDVYFSTGNEPFIHKDFKECLNALFFVREQDLSLSERSEIDALSINVGSELIAIEEIVTESYEDYENYKKCILDIAENDFEFAQTQDVLSFTENISTIKEMALQQLRARYREFAQSRQKQVESIGIAKRAEITNALLRPLKRRKSLVESLLHECAGNSELHTAEQCATAREYLIQIDRSIEDAHSRAEVLLNNFKI